MKRKLLLAVALLPTLCSCGSSNQPYITELKQMLSSSYAKVLRESYELIYQSYNNQYYYTDYVYSVDIFGNYIDNIHFKRQKGDVELRKYDNQGVRLYNSHWSLNYVF